MGKFSVRRLVFSQFVASILAGMVASGYWDVLAGYSAFLGGLTICLANAWYLWRLFGGELQREVKPSGEVFASYIRAETGKFLLLALLLAIVFAAAGGSDTDDVDRSSIVTRLVLKPQALFMGLLIVQVYAVWSMSAALRKRILELDSEAASGNNL